MTNGYYGWRNYETWLVNVWYGDVFTDMINDGEELTADAIEQFVMDYIFDQIKDNNGFMNDIINNTIDAVDWQEIADHYIIEKNELEKENT